MKEKILCILVLLTSSEPVTLVSVGFVVLCVTGLVIAMRYRF